MNDVRANFALALGVAIDHRSGGFVAGGLDAQNEHAARLPERVA
jgi:hypothetical protein